MTRGDVIAGIVNGVIVGAFWLVVVLVTDFEPNVGAVAGAAGAAYAFGRLEGRRAVPA